MEKEMLLQTKKSFQTDHISGNRKSFWGKLLYQRELLFIAAPFVVLVLIFNYFPLWGWIMAFQNYKPSLGVLGSPWVGLENFRRLFAYSDFYRALRNTLAISGLKYIMGFSSTIILAILLNEVRNLFMKRVVQTVSYLPHFVSWVVAANIVLTALSPNNGIINDMLLRLHIISKPILFIGNASYFWLIVALSDVWKEVGWGAIIYLAAMSGIDPQLYEAVSIDGGGRFTKIRYVTLPGIVPVIKILLIMNAGWILYAGMEQVLLLRNPTVTNVSQTLELFILTYGIQKFRYSFATAAGIFNSIVSMLLLFGANMISKKISGEKAF
jgi:putative aldouronate transport system permease protein